MERLSDEEMAQMRSRFEASTDGVLGVAEGYLAAPKGRKIMVHDLRRERPGNGGYAVATFGPLSAPDSRPDAEMFAHARIDGLALLDNLVDARTALATLKADLRLSRVDESDRRCHMPGCGRSMYVRCTCGLVEKMDAAAARVDAALKEGK